MTLDRAFVRGVVLQRFYLQWYVMGWYKFECLTNASINKLSYCSFEFISLVFFAPFNGDLASYRQYHGSLTSPSHHRTKKGESWNVLKGT